MSLPSGCGLRPRLRHARLFLVSCALLASGVVGDDTAAACTHARVAVQRVAPVQHRLCFAPSSLVTGAGCRLGDVLNLTVALGSTCGIFELDAPRSSDDVRTAYRADRALMGYLELDARAAPLDLACTSDDRLVVRTSPHECAYEINAFTSSDYLTVGDGAGGEARVALHATLPPSPPPLPPPPPPPSPSPPLPFAPPPPLGPDAGAGAWIGLAVALSLLGAAGCVFACGYAAYRAHARRARDAASGADPSSASATSSLVGRVVARRARVAAPAAETRAPPSASRAPPSASRAPPSASAAASSSSSSTSAATDAEPARPSRWQQVARRLRVGASAAPSTGTTPPPAAPPAAPRPRSASLPPTGSASATVAAGRKLPTISAAGRAAVGPRRPIPPVGHAVPSALAMRGGSVEALRARARR